VSVAISSRDVSDVTVVNLTGRVTLGEATGKVRDAVRELVERGRTKILLDLGGVTYIDSAGLGELVGAYTTVANKGGQLKLLNVTGRALDLMQVTKLATIFELFEDEAAGVRSFP
jgi:anti-sigma B factor antagonist